MCKMYWYNLTGQQGKYSSSILDFLDETETKSQEDKNEKGI